jgi:hypothetical protein
MLKVILSLSYLLRVFSQQTNVMLPGGQGSDQHGCVLDGGYSWCESSQKCIRPWEEDCPPLQQLEGPMINVEFCPASNIQMCRMACDDPICPTGQCAMRQGNCCDYTCIDSSLGEDESCENVICPPQPPCPMPAVREGCRWSPPVYDHCGCSSGCGSLDCSTVHKAGVGETCGGFMPYGMASTCEDGLECVNTMGPMIADAPGTCQRPCNGIRDSMGRCSENTPEIPWNCASWNDGCNTCSVQNGVIGACTLMMCFTNNEPYCSTYYSGQLRVGDLCYRFCEDGTKSQIDRRSDCPKGTTCVSENSNLIGFDSCADVMKCVAVGH